MVRLDIVLWYYDSCWQLIVFIRSQILMFLFNLTRYKVNKTWVLVIAIKTHALGIVCFYLSNNFRNIADIWDTHPWLSCYRGQLKSLLVTSEGGLQHQCFEKSLSIKKVFWAPEWYTGEELEEVETKDLAPWHSPLLKLQGLPLPPWMEW